MSGGAYKSKSTGVIYPAANDEQYELYRTRVETARARAELKQAIEEIEHLKLLVAKLISTEKEMNHGSARS